MPEIKIKHIVSFSSEDTVYKAENLLKPETFRKWKCATSGEKNAIVVLQFEKSSQIQSVHIGNDHSAFIEVLVGRSSDSTNDYQVLLSASSFMSPLESRNSTNSNRVRMFGSEKFPTNVKNEKWDCVQIICTQPFNKNVQYGLSFVKFHSVPDPSAEAPAIQKKEEIKLGAFKLNTDDDSELPVGSWFLKRNEKTDLSATNPAAIRGAVCTARNINSVLPRNMPQQSLGKKRKLDEEETPSALLKKKDSAHSNSEKIGHKHVDINQGNGASKSPPVLAGSPANVRNSPPIIEKPTTNRIEYKGQKKKRGKKSFSQIMEKVVFAISGFQNPHRGEIRERATEMGARYKGDWDSTCTHLICAFVNTPKYVLVRGQGGRIVSKNWVYDCHKRKELLPWRKYMLGQYSKSTTEEEDTSENEELEASTANKKEVEKLSTSSRMNGSLVLPSTSKFLDSEPPLRKSDKRESEEKLGETNVGALDDDDDDNDTNAESDYLAATDVDSSTDGDTEDEIRRVEQRNQNIKKQISPKKTNGDILDANSAGTSPSDSSAVLSTKPNTDGLNLPDLPDFFKSRKFFLYGDFSKQEKHELQRYITAYNGFIVDCMSKDVKYVITLSKWNSDFDEGLSENEDLTFVRPQWIYKCHEKGKFIPFQPHIVIPDL